MIALLFISLLFLISPGVIELSALIMLLVFPQRLLEILAIYGLFFPFLMLLRN
ncbi:Transmembrane domain-containing protein [Brazilian cedratvirus IHUMI]|uniref:Transmembrane domain-containing protein n=1 Tax=Brazilian cedratvirus IHUMI TaxID=2126980 RepID=A0A2R8FE71_9VIRU|nr:Transmembrane domain-containing protein [Brazilian cedratvirus IHUMI]